MKITPLSDIAIRGVHSPKGVPVEVPQAEAFALIADGLAVRTPAEPVIEAAAVAPVVETAAVAPVVTKKRRAA